MPGPIAQSVYPANVLGPWLPEPMVPSVIREADAAGNVRAMLNPRWLDIAYYWMQAEAPRGTQAIIVGANATLTASFLLGSEGRRQGAMRIFGLMSNQTANFSVFLVHTTLDRPLMDVPIPHNLIFGANARLPGRPIEAIPLDAVSAIQAQLTDTSGAPNTIRTSLGGPRYFGRQPPNAQQQWFRRLTHPYWMGISGSTIAGQPVAGEVALGAGATATLFFQVPSSAYFECNSFLDDSTGGYNLQLFEGLEGRSYMSAPIPIGHIAAVSAAGFPAAGNPAFLLQPIRFEPATTIRIVVTDTSGNPNRIRFAMHGRLIYAEAQERG